MSTQALQLAAVIKVTLLMDLVLYAFFHLSDGSDSFNYIGIVELQRFTEKCAIMAYFRVREQIRITRRRV